jgi:photosystem II stability/assembly factor-like uncharacterized protein
MRRGAWVVMFVGLLAALPGAAKDSPLPSVDLGVRELDVWGLMLVSRRTDTDWWAVASVEPVFDEASARESFRVFRSADAGRSWREDVEVAGALTRANAAPDKTGKSRFSTPIDFLVWYTPEVGLMAGYIGPKVLRTTDGGRTWSPVELPDNLWVYDLERAGGRTWLCGSSGSIYRSDDAGATWTELKGTPFNTTDRCMDMSFLDPEHGQAVGLEASYWGTEDGGTTWRRLEPPHQPLRRMTEIHTRPPELRHVAWLTPEVAWVQGSGGRFQTTDGGKTWQLRPFAASEGEAHLSVTKLPDGRRLLTEGATADGAAVETLVPSFMRDAVVMDDATAVTLDGNRVSTYVSGRRVRASPLTTAGSGVLTPLDGLGPRQPEAWFGWKADQVVLSQDQGQRWFSVGRVPGKPLRTLALAKDGRLFAQTQAKKLFVSMDLGRTWEPSKAPLDAHDFAVATGASPQRLESPLHCLLTAPEAVVKVRFDIVGCFGGTNSHLDLALSEGQATLAGRSEAGEKPLEVRARTVSRDEGQRILRALVDAATREETPLGCESTTRYQTSIEWSCAPKQAARHKVEFEASGCGPLTRVDVVGGATSTGAATPDGYARSLGVYGAAAQALEGASR